jgi:hypothetical protein
MCYTINGVGKTPLNCNGAQRYELFLELQNIFLKTEEK